MRFLLSRGRHRKWSFIIFTGCYLLLTQTSFGQTQPEVLFKVTASIINDDLFGTPTVGSFGPTVGNSFNWNVPNGNQGSRNASSIGNVSAGRVTGTFSSDFLRFNTSNSFWFGITEQTRIEAYVRGASGTRYSLDLRVTGTMQAQASVQNGGVSQSRINTITVRHDDTPNTRTYDEFANITEGTATDCGYTFPEFPNAVYCKVRTVTADSGVFGVNGGSVSTNLSGVTSGSFDLTVRNSM